MNKYEPVIGLEIHVQLKTKSKMFSSCPVPQESDPPNTMIDPLAVGHPGTLPVINRQAVQYAVMAAMALECEIHTTAHFDRKSYFYPDLPKGYQISQSALPFGHDGHIIIQAGDVRRRIRIERVHLEEDTGKLIHDPDAQASYVDYNRAGTPLVEIVTYPDFQSPAEAKTFLQELRLMMRYLGISDADMERGQLRCDANVSLRPNPSYFTGERAEQGTIGLDPNRLYPKTEIKNLNSFRSVERALQYEIERQTKLWDADQAPTVQSTRGWDEKRGETFEQRVKEEMHDYRYFPEPDLPTVHLDEAFMAEAQRLVGELPADKRTRFMDEYGLGTYDTDILVSDRALGNYFEKVISELRAWLISDAGLEGSETDIWERHGKKLVKKTANWVISRLLNLVNTHRDSWESLPVTEENFAELMKLVFQRQLNNQTAVTVLERMYTTGGDPSDIMEAEDVSVMNDSDSLQSVIDEVIAECPEQVADYRAGKTPVLQYLVGQVMKKTKGQADAQAVAELLRTKLQ